MDGVCGGKAGCLGTETRISQAHRFKTVRDCLRYFFFAEVALRADQDQCMLSFPVCLCQRLFWAVS